MKLDTVGLVVLKENKLLLAFSGNKHAWYLPGGKVDKGETNIEALVREIDEELNIELNVESLEYYRHVTAPAYGERSDVVMEQECFIYKLTEEMTPSKEIEALHYFDLDEYLKEPAQVPGVLILFSSLSKDGLI